MTPFTEDDLKVIKWIQELKSCKVSQATEVYRQYAKKLANSDHPQRHEIIWENVQRGAGKQVDGESEACPDQDKVQAAMKKLDKILKKRNKEKAMSPTETKTKKPRQKKVKPKPSESAPRPKVELADLTREVELTPAGGEFKHAYTANLFGKKHAVVLAEIDHGNGVEDRFGYIPVSIARLKQACDFAAQNDKLPVAVAAIVRVKGRLDQGYVVPRDVFEQFMSKSKHALTLSAKARLAYRENGWDDCKFSVAKTEEAAAA